jgi:hydrogenase maturation protease
MAGTGVLFLCYGNPGRLDDGLGAAFAESFTAPVGVEVDADYQLSIEDAQTLADYTAVVFVDAAVVGPEPFCFSPVVPDGAVLSFSSHSVSPAALLALARDLFGAEPAAYTLAIRGYDFDDFGERLSVGAQRNLEVALDFAATWASDAVKTGEGAHYAKGAHHARR